MEKNKIISPDINTTQRVEVLFIYEHENEIIVTDKMLDWKYQMKVSMQEDLNDIVATELNSIPTSSEQKSFLSEEISSEQIDPVENLETTNSDDRIKLRRLSTSLREYSHAFWTLQEYKEFVDQQFHDSKNKLAVKTTISPFVFDNTDSSFKQASDSIIDRTKYHPIRNIGLVFRSMLKSFFTSGTGIWYLAIITFISVLLINNLWNVRTVDITINFSGIRFNYTQPIFYTNYSSFTSIYITPLIAITTIFLPAYVVSMRSNSTFKRFGLYGISKEQLNLGITLTSISLIVGSALIIGGPITYLSKLFTSWIIGGDYKLNLLFPFDLTPNYGLLYFFLILGTITFTQASIFIGAKLNQTRSAIFVGIAFTFIASFTMYQTGGLPKPSVDVEGTLLVVYNVFRWLFLISPYTIFLQAISLTANDPGFIYSLSGFTLENLVSFVISSSDNVFAAPPYGIVLNNQEWLDWMPFLCAGLAIGFGFIPLWKSNSWIKFGGIR